MRENTGTSVDLSGLSDGELMDLAVPSGSVNRRALVIWLFLRERPPIPIDEWDSVVASSAEKELERRSVASQPVATTH